jgi:hypothetical protein
MDAKRDVMEEIAGVRVSKSYVLSLGFVSCWCSCDVVGPPTAEENTGTAEKELIACVRRKN